MGKRKSPNIDLKEDMDDCVDVSNREIMDMQPAEKMCDRVITFERWYPILEKFGDPDGMSVERMLNTATPLSVAKLVELMMDAKSEKVQAQCARDIAHMGGLKPVERQNTVNVNVMARQEAVSLLTSKLEKYGVEVIDGEVVDEEDGETEAMVEESKE